MSLLIVVSVKKEFGGGGIKAHQKKNLKTSN